MYMRQMESIDHSGKDRCFHKEICGNGGPFLLFLIEITNFSQKISTRCLTVLIMCVILHAEQRKAAKKREFPTPDRFPAGQNKTGQQDGGRALPKFFHIDNNELHQ